MHWIERYKTKLRTPSEAVKIIQSEQRVYVHRLRMRNTCAGNDRTLQ